MGKRRSKKSKAPLTWKLIQGAVRLLTQGIFKAGPLLLFGAVGFGIFWGIRENLYADPGFLIQSVEVISTKGVSGEKIASMQKLYLNKNLFRISPSEVVKVAQQDPQVREARVTRLFPHTLKIEMMDRTVFGQVQFVPENVFYSVAEDGIVLGIESSRNLRLPLIEFLEGSSPVENGKRLLLPGFKEAVNLTRAFSRHPLARIEQVDKIRLDHLGNVSLVLKNGPELRFGRTPSKRLSQLNSLGGLLAGPERKDLVYIDLQFDDLIVRKKNDE